MADDFDPQPARFYMPDTTFIPRPSKLRCVLGIVVWAISISSAGISAADLSKAGKLVIAGGAISSAGEEVWQVMLAGRLDGRPIGIISTASEEPSATGEPFAARINAAHGAGSAVFLPLGVKGVNADDASVAEAVRRCGGFFFTGGQQDRTTRILMRKKGAHTAAMAAIWEVYLRGGIVGGSSAGAAVMSDPMLAGGQSEDAVRGGVVKPGSTTKGVALAAGLGFHPGMLYCQHHLERGRYGRLMVSVVSDLARARLGIGVCENTAWVVDHQASTGRVIGANGVLVLDASDAKAGPNGGWSGLRVHYLTAGDRLRFKTGEVVPDAGKTRQPALDNSSQKQVRFPAWEKNALRTALRQMAKAPKVTRLIGEDGPYAVQFDRQPGTVIFSGADEANITLTNLTVSLKVHTPDLGLKLPVGRNLSRMAFHENVIRVFSYKPADYQDGPLLVVMHGMDRNAEDYRDRAVVMADQFHALVVAPEFDLKQFPIEAYQRGGVMKDGKAQPAEKWTFKAVSDLVKNVRAVQHKPDLPYYVIGHSAGGQILTRLAAFLPGDATRIVAANPGTLIFPNREAAFPLGFGGLPDALGNDDALRRYLASPLTLYLGDRDLGSQNLDLTPAAKVQGMTRYERGQNCYQQAAALAKERGWPFAWRIVVADGVGHDSECMFAHPQVKAALFE